jgi:hypothetical protein
MKKGKMKKTALGFTVETDSNQNFIRIYQSDDCYIAISPDEVDAMISWLRQAKAEMNGEVKFDGVRGN